MENTKTSKLNTYLLVFVALMSVLLIFVTGAVLITVRGNVKTGEGTPTPTPTPATPTQESRDEFVTEEGVLRRIESTLILQTTVFRIDTVVRAKREGSWFFNWGGQNILLFVQGTVTAGVDLKDLDKGDIEVSQENKTIVITLPPAQVLNAVLTDYQVENYKGEEPEEVIYDLIKEGLEAGREQIAATACESGILQYATTDAERAFTQIASFADFTGYEVVIKTTPVTDCSIDVTIEQ